jgi:hypothetical protein
LDCKRAIKNNQVRGNQRNLSGDQEIILCIEQGQSIKFTFGGRLVRCYNQSFSHWPQKLSWFEKWWKYNEIFV